MALHLIFSRSYYNSCSTPTIFNISRISCYSESEEWSTINLSPPQFPKKKKKKKGGIYHPAFSCNGLSCFRTYHEFEDDEFVLWNPSTDTVQLIPHTDSRYIPCLCSSDRCYMRVIELGCGLGFDAESQDYKLVRFMINCTCCHYTFRHVAVYSSKNNSWKEVLFPFGFYVNGNNGKAVFVNGFCYWTTSADVILSFELSSDNFSTLPYPDDVAGDFNTGFDVFLLELDGSLGLVILFDQLEKAAPAILFSFWVYEGSSSPSPSPWTRKINLDVRLDAKNKPLWLGKKKKNNYNLVLLLEGVDGALLEYDYTRRELKKIDQIHDVHPSRMMISPVYPYVENETSTSTTANIAGAGAGEDRLSQLPDDIILTILSFLSLKEAASTTVLSTRWSDLWRHAPNLYFHDTHKLFFKTHSKHSKDIGWVNSDVESHKTVSLKESNISFPLNKPARRTLTEWLGFAFSRPVEALELHLLRTRFVSPEKFLQTRSMLKYLTNLTSLCLKCLKVSGQDIGLFLRNCPLLERLIIKHATLTSDLEVCGGMLKHLDIQYCKGDKFIKGYAPSITYLRIHSGLKLVCATKQSVDDDDPPSFISSQLTTLDFTLYCMKCFLKKGPAQMPTMRELTLTYYGRGHGIQPITSLLCAFPYLEEFEIKNYKWNLIEYRGVGAVNNVETFCHRHLRVFKFTWFNVGDGDHMELMSCILDNCVALQKIILHKYAANSASHVAAIECVKQLQFKVPSHIQFIIT